LLKMRCCSDEALGTNVRGRVACKRIVPARMLQPVLLRLFLCTFLFPWPLITSWMPGLVRIETVHAFENLQRVWPKILLVNDPAGANDERLHSGHAILSRRGCQGEPTDHRSLNNKVHLAQRRGGTLPFQNLEIVAVIRLTPLRVALLQRFGDLLSHRTSPSSVRVLPRQTVMFPRWAD